MKAYLEISVEKELPKDAGQHFVLEQGDKKYGIGGIQRKHISYVVPHTVGRGLELKPSHENYKVTHYLKEFSLPELMGDLLFKKYTDEFQVPFERLEQVRKECIEEATQYLTQKGIL
jgi:hypothetical protein